jgi:tetratricopeptide (TPR) repeat protein
VLAAEDPGFREALARLVGQAERDPVVGRLATTITGHAQVGKVVTIGHAGEVHVHLPPAPPQTIVDRLHRATTSGPVVANLPARNPAFTGRAEPPDSGRVLVTSRYPTWAGLASSLVVDVLSRAEAVAFLRDRSGRDDPAFDQLAAALGDLPLALEQAAAYLEETATTPSQYLTLLTTRARELFALGRPTATEQTIATVWTISQQRLRKRMPAAEDLLVLCAFLAADDIPSTLPAQHPDLLPKRLAATVQDPLAYQQAIGALRRYSLIKTSRDGQALSVHRLVQAVTRQQLDRKQARRWATAALLLLLEASPARHTDPDAWPNYARLIPHVVAVTDHAGAGDIGVEEATWLLTDAGLYLWQRADYRQARTLHERALSIREARLGPNHPDTALSLTNLANVLGDQGDLDTARSLYERALTIYETRLGPDHPDTVRMRRNLAAVVEELDTSR